jgi:hypothetical protein
MNPQFGLPVNMPPFEQNAALPGFAMPVAAVQASFQSGNQAQIASLLQQLSALGYSLPNEPLPQPEPMQDVLPTPSHGSSLGGNAAPQSSNLVGAPVGLQASDREEGELSDMDGSRPRSDLPDAPRSHTYQHDSSGTSTAQRQSGGRAGRKETARYSTR